MWQIARRLSRYSRPGCPAICTAIDTLLFICYTYIDRLRCFTGRACFLSKVIQAKPTMSLVYSLEGSCTYVPGFGKLLTLLQVTPKSELFHSPLPLRAPKNKILFLFGSIVRRSPSSAPAYCPHLKRKLGRLPRIAPVGGTHNLPVLFIP